MIVTIFPDKSAVRLKVEDLTTDELAERIESARTFPAKDACPLIKLARFGDRATDKACLRHDANVIEISGAEGDYDGGSVSIADAQIMLYENNVESILYTSPSHTPEKPRWRVLCPLSKSYQPSERARFVARLNGVLGGILGPESFTLSQSFYIGKVNGAVYESALVRGTPIDLLPALDAKAVYSEKRQGEARAERQEKTRSSDPVIARLTERGLMLRHRSDGGVDIVCPFEGQHTTPRAPGDCTYWPAHTGGFQRGHFKCLHSHCLSRADADFLKAIGIETNTTGSPDEPAGWPAPLDLETLARTEPAPPSFIMDDWLPTGYATLFAGHGGVGKSGIALHLAVCIAAGVPFFGAHVERKRVMYLSCEDRAGILHWRLRRICAYVGLDLADLRGWLTVFDLVGRDAVLWERDPRTGSTVTAAFAWLAERIREHGTEVPFVDGITDTFAGNENARGDVKRFVNGLMGLLPAERGAVLLVGHIAKPAAANAVTSEGYSGSTSWHNSVRARWYLYPETEQGEDGGRPERTGELLLELQKSNMGRTDQAMRFRWDDEAHLFIGEAIGATTFDRKHRDREEKQAIRLAMKTCMDSGDGIPAAMTGPRTAFHVLKARQGFPDSLCTGKGGTRRFWRHIEELRAMRHVDEERIARKSDRHLIRHLVLTQEGMRACGK